MNEFLGAAAPRALDLANRMLGYLDRIGPALLRLGRVLRLWAGIGAVAGVLTVVLLAASASPLSSTSVVLLVFVVAVVGWAPVTLWFYAGAMSSVAELPDWLRSRPGVLAQHGDQLAGIYQETAGKWGDNSKVGLVGAGLARAGRVAWKVGRDIPEFAMATRLVNPLMIAAAVIGIFWIAAVILCLPIVALVALV